MALTLHGSPFSTFTRSARLALAEKGVGYTLARAMLGDPSYTALHPWRKMPVLDHDGFRVFEATAVMRYVDEAFDGPALQPADVRARARMTQWMSAYNDYVAPHAVRGVLIPRFVLASRGVAVDDARVQEAAAKARSALAVFERALAASPYLAGEAPSLADWLLLPTVVMGDLLAAVDRFTEDLPHVAAWAGRLRERPSFAATEPG